MRKWVGSIFWGRKHRRPKNPYRNEEWILAFTILQIWMFNYVFLYVSAGKCGCLQMPETPDPLGARFTGSYGLTDFGSMKRIQVFSKSNMCSSLRSHFSRTEHWNLSQLNKTGRKEASDIKKDWQQLHGFHLSHLLVVLHRARRYETKKDIIDYRAKSFIAAREIIRTTTVMVY